MCANTFPDTSKLVFVQKQSDKAMTFPLSSSSLHTPQSLPPLASEFVFLFVADRSSPDQTPVPNALLQFGTLATEERSGDHEAGAGLVKVKLRVEAEETRAGDDATHGMRNVFILF